MKDAKKPEELFDDELQQLMGDQYTDLTQKPAEAAEDDEAVPAVWEVIRDHAQTWDVLGLAKWALTFGGLFGLILYWQVTGLMDPVAAGPCMCVCTALAGYGVGKNLNK